MTSVAEDRLIEAFFESSSFAVVGASNDPSKYGHKVLESYRQHGFKAYPVNPREEQIQGLRCYASLAALTEPVGSVSVITPPAVTEKIVEEVATAGIRNLWLQPGAESPEAIATAEALGLSVIHSGPCVLVVMPHYAPERKQT